MIGHYPYYKNSTRHINYHNVDWRCDESRELIESSGFNADNYLEWLYKNFCHAEANAATKVFGRNEAEYKRVNFKSGLERDKIYKLESRLRSCYKSLRIAIYGGLPRSDYEIFKNYYYASALKKESIILEEDELIDINNLTPEESEALRFRLDEVRESIMEEVRLITFYMGEEGLDFEDPKNGSVEAHKMLEEIKNHLAPRRPTKNARSRI
jgi:hypothetical protein